MDSATKGRVEKTVIEILEKSDMQEMTESKVRALASERLGVDLSAKETKRFVRGVVESFLISKAQKDDQQPQLEETDRGDRKRGRDDDGVEEEEEEGGGANDDAVDENGDLILCRVLLHALLLNRKTRLSHSNGNHDYGKSVKGKVYELSNRRRVTLQEFRGKTLVSIREYYEKDGKQLPSSKGISLTPEQWAAFKRAVPAIEEAIREIQSS